MGNLNVNSSPVKDFTVQRTDETGTDIIILTVISDTQKVECKISHDQNNGQSLDVIETKLQKCKDDVLTNDENIGISPHYAYPRSQLITITYPNGDKETYTAEISIEEM